MERAGDARIASTERGLRVVLPVKFTLDARGSGFARARRETRSERRLLTAEFAATLSDRLVITLARRPTVQLAGAEKISVLDGTVDADSLVPSRVASALAGLTPPLNRALADLMFADTVDRAWRQLHYPVQISVTPRRWLRGDPKAITFGGFVAREGARAARIAINGPLALYDDERPLPLLPRPRPAPRDASSKLASAQSVPARTAANDDSATNAGSSLPTTRLSAPVTLPYTEIADRVRAALEKAGPITARAAEAGASTEGAAATTQFDITGVEVFATGQRLALAVSLSGRPADAWQPIVGTVYLVGTPYVAPSSDMMGLRAVEFTALRPIPALFEDGKFIIPDAPFISAFDTGMRIPLTERFSSELARINALTDGTLVDGLSLAGKFDRLAVAQLRPQRDGLRIDLEAVGQLVVEKKAAPNPAPPLVGREAVSTEQ